MIRKLRAIVDALVEKSPPYANLRGVSNHLATYLTDGDLPNLLMGSMIRARYRGRIIGYDIRAVQSWSPLSSTAPQSYLPTALKSYLPTALKSYLPTALKSYLPTALKSYLRASLAGFCAVPALLILQGSGGEPRLDEFLDTGEDQTNGSDTDSDTDGPHKPHREVNGSRGQLGYGYARQSQTQENDEPENAGGSKESSSIRTQKKNIRATAKKYEIPLRNIFVDKDESGFTFEREGFQDLEEQLEQHPGPVVLDRINRLGRNTLETIYMVGKLHYEYGVSLVTSRHGKYEFDDMEDHILLVGKCIASHQSVSSRTKSTWNTIRNRFTNRIWYTWFDNVPVGYHLPSDDGWPQVAPDGPEVVTAIMKDLIQTKTYSVTIDHIQQAANNNVLVAGSADGSPLGEVSGDKIRSVFEKSDYDLDKFNGRKLKRMVTNTIYIGEVRYPRSADESDQNVMEDSDLQIVDEELFNTVNEVVKKIHADYSTSTDDNVDGKTLAEKGLLTAAIEKVDIFKPVCPECNRGMKKNRQDSLGDGLKAHYWICPKYNEEGQEADRQRKFPTEEEWQTLKKHLREEYENQDTEHIMALRVCEVY